MSDRYWLLLEKSDGTRISKGIDGYQDKTGETYQYDSFVPNYKHLGVGDYVVLRKENDILGVGLIGAIKQVADVKIHRRCPECRSTDIRERANKKPVWKCGKCAYEFQAPNETNVEIKSFIASIVEFAKLNAPPTVKEVKSCAVVGDGITSQLSILEIDPRKIKTLLEGRAPTPSPRCHPPRKGGQGFGLSQKERKVVEMHAMRIARQLYEMEGWEVIDTSASQPYDLLATRDDDKRFIEVKGTTGLGGSIILTQGEVNHARKQERCSALVVVSEILINESGGALAASGGVVSAHEDPWHIDASALEATEFRYRIEQQSPNNALLRPPSSGADEL